jgi:NADH-quinone oxidoreductase subunit M
MLWLYQRVFFGKASAEVTALKDLNLREYATIVPLIILMVWMGTFTQSFIPSISTSTAVILGPVDAKRDVHVSNSMPGALHAQKEQGVLPAKESVDAR